MIYQPAENHTDSQPIKLFEFMAAGLPVIASDFPLWKSIVEENSCGICVDPCDAKAVRAACEKLLFDPSRSKELGLQGRKTVEVKYSWDSEGEKLLRLYEAITI